jgi:hypothetical protein
MDKAMLRDHLARTELHVQLGLTHIAKQHAIIAALERDRHDTKMAREILTTLEETQALHVADRDRLMKKLAEGE